MSAPLICNMVPRFNEEAFVERAILCTFEQTYTPLEIMQNMTGAYEGPHDVRVIEQPDHFNVYFSKTKKS
ncbi:MAG: glycosyltransferase [Rhodospirillaceae bacterium]|jgi:hypothetical protein|nr:glycosyltransferase [Rhodospirillaceae bacterium]MBT3492634.1 glycosyltransferase [Rhodospirillaceae bacterium]MBT3782503.1 glycosyltransferase [Rhodospirillaceae bacterium]MBT3978632.1 glycosyltransferase [Rhodospirillaceae bacterium]MBT4167307.1 glycosyltransferase [Rhodospirillaceae bacterium]